jgi:hypothetical protein
VSPLGLQNLPILLTSLALGLEVFSHKQRALVIVGVAVFCWALWLRRNDVVSQKSKSKSILQVMFRRTFWMRSWSILSREEGRSILKEGCHLLETCALEFLNSSGWNVFFERKKVECFKTYRG